jgi:hypothetical protein
MPKTKAICEPVMSNELRTGNSKGEIQGSLHCGGKCAASGRDDVGFVVGGEEQATATAAGWRVYVPQPSPDQAGSGWGTGAWGELEKAVVCFRKRYPTLSR